MNKVFVERELYRDRANELLVDLDSCLTLSNKTIAAKDRVIESQKRLLMLDNEIIENDSLQIVQLNKDIERGWKKEKWLKTERGVLFIGIVVLVVKILL